jgi:hypothetical protein
MYLIAPLLLSCLIFVFIGRKQLIARGLFALFPSSDPMFVKILERAILWLLTIGALRLVYSWIYRTLAI